MLGGRPGAMAPSKGLGFVIFALTFPFDQGVQADDR
jgi:hypothetical protein